MIPPLITRFAPSPTGYLHLGHVAHAQYVWSIAKARGANVLLRIEDHDRSRWRPEYEQAIIEDLEWLGFQWDGAITRQSGRHALYQEHCERLRAQGLVYACDCSRKEILARTGGASIAELRYDNHCRDRGLPLAPGLGWRLRMPDEWASFEDALLGPQRQYPAGQCGDVLIRDPHNQWTYQFAVVVDDWLQGVNLVIRGEDLLDSTGRQIILAKLLGRETQPAWYHHPLLMDADTGRKLSKRDQSHAIREMRLAGVSPQTILAKADAADSERRI